MQTTGNVERQYGGPGTIDRRDGLGKAAFDEPIEPCAEQRIDEELASQRLSGVEGLGNAPGCRKILVGPKRIATEPVCGNEAQDPNVGSRRGREPREHVAVAGVVAGSA